MLNAYVWKGLGLSLAVVAGASLTGCSGDGTSKASVTGSVTYNSQAVKGGFVTLTPIAGAPDETPMRPAAGAVKPDGTFVLGTESEDDGASIGKHRVSYSPPDIEWEAPEWDGTGEPPQKPKSEYEGLIPSVVEVEVPAGGTTLKIELVQAPPPEQQ